MRKWVVVVVASLVAVAGGATGLWKYSREAAAESRPTGPAGRVVSVQVERVRRADVRVVLSGLGTVVPNRTVSVKSRVAGQLRHIAFTEGQVVRQGQLLAELDPRPFQAEVDKARGLLLREQALVENSRVELDRNRALAESSLVSGQQVAAQQSLHDQHRGGELIAQGGLSAAQLQLDFSRVTAPIGGRVGFRLVDVGNNVTPSDNLLQIHEVQPIAAIFTLTEDQVQGVLERLRASEKSGSALAVEAWDKGSKNLLEKGRLLTLDNQIDTTTGTVRLKAEFPNADGHLFPSQFVNVRLAIDELKGVLELPRTAVQRGRDGAFAYVVGAGGVVEVKAIVLGVADGSSIVVTEGLGEGEQVVVGGADQIRAGAKVKPIEKASGGPRSRP